MIGKICSILLVLIKCFAEPRHISNISHTQIITNYANSTEIHNIKYTPAFDNIDVYDCSIPAFDMLNYTEPETLETQMNTLNYTETETLETQMNTLNYTETETLETQMNMLNYTETEILETHLNTLNYTETETLETHMNTLNYTETETLETHTNTLNYTETETLETHTNTLNYTETETLETPIDMFNVYHNTEYLNNRDLVYIRKSTAEECARICLDTFMCIAFEIIDETNCYLVTNIFISYKTVENPDSNVHILKKEYVEQNWYPRYTRLFCIFLGTIIILLFLACLDCENLV
jgi:nitrate reductase NapAB chaperone NapD